MKRKYIAGILISVIVTSLPINIYAEPLSAEDSKAIEEGKENLSKAEKELNDIGEKLSEVTGDIEQRYGEIENNKTELERIVKENESNQIEISVLEDDIKVSEEKFGKRLDTIYKAGGTNSYLQLLLSAESLSDFLSRVGALNELLDLDKVALENLQSKKEQLDRKVERLVKNKENIEKLTEENKVKIKEQEEKKVELDKVYDEYEKKLKSAEVDLSEREKNLYKYWRDIINNSKSNKEDLEKAKKALDGIKGQVTSSNAKADIDKLLNKANEGIKNEENKNKLGLSGKAGDIIAYGMTFTNGNYSYRLGANGPNAYDCSSFMQKIFGAYGISLPRHTYKQGEQGVKVNYSDLQPGDLIFTEMSAGGPEHVGVYVGNGQMLHAANPRSGIIVGPIYHYGFARRIL